MNFVFILSQTDQPGAHTFMTTSLNKWAMIFKPRRFIKVKLTSWAHLVAAGVMSVGKHDRI